MWEYREQEHQQGFKTKIVSCDPRCTRRAARLIAFGGKVGVSSEVGSDVQNPPTATAAPEERGAAAEPTAPPPRPRLPSCSRTVISAASLGKS